MLTFDEPTHTYLWNGEPRPSVTTILDPLDNFAGIPYAVLEKARQRGDWVHKATEHIENGLVVEDVPEGFQGYLDAYVKFVGESGFETLLNEARVHSAKHKYAGTTDRIGFLKRSKAVVDIKASFVPPASAAPQTAAYLEAYNETADQKATKRFTLHLKPDGNYELVPHKNRKDFSIFLYCLYIHQWREENVTT